MEKANNNLHINTCGINTVNPTETVGPAAKTYYQILYVLEGSGTLTIQGKKYQLDKGCGFLVNPDEMVICHTDRKSPWTYAFVGFVGSNAESLIESVGLTKEKPLFKTNKVDKVRQIIDDMIESFNYKLSSELKRKGLFVLLLSVITEDVPISVSNYQERSEHYVNKATEYIRNNYCNPIKVTDVADYVQVNRSYLYTLFMSTIDVSPHQYLSNCRIKRASLLLETTKGSIESVALSCGYADSLVFTKAFKQVKGVSPSSYRKAAQQK